MTKTPVATGEGGQIAPIIKGVFKAIILTVVLSLLLGVIFYFSNLPENLGPPISSAILVLSAFWGGATAARTTKSRGLFVGLTTGTAYFLFLTLFTLTIFKVQFSALGIAQKGLLSLFAGGLGGIFGVTRN